MAKQTKKKSFIKFLLWFTFLSTLGVGGGIFFLLFAVVPIEQGYTDRGWSQFKIDSIMRYYVIGWVLFGFIMSFIYYQFTVRKERWKTSIAFALVTILICVGGIYYFLNTGSALVQGSQGEVVEGERFTFGPYPEKEDIERLHEEGYDGVITLLNPTLPIEKPLLDKEKKNANEAGMTLHSLPMLPWVGDNSDSIEKVKELIKEDGKKYYVHCYLGRHRVDVIKQVINEELDEGYQLMFLQPTTLERGALHYFADDDILIGPYPTDEEWFTRIRRAEVQQVVSIIDPSHKKWLDKEKKVTKEMDIKFKSMPIGKNPTIEEIKKVADYAIGLNEKSYIHGFADLKQIDMLEAYISWGKTLKGVGSHIQLQSGEYIAVGQKLLIGYNPTASDHKKLKDLGIEVVELADTKSTATLYDQVKKIKEKKQLTYLIVEDAATMQKLDRIAIGLLYGSLDRGKEWKDLELTNGSLIRHERNLVIGPMLTEKEYADFAQTKGVAQLVYLHAASTTSEEQLQQVKDLAKKYHITLKVIPMYEGYEETLIPTLHKENGLNYIMTDEELMQLVNDFIKKF